MSKYEKLNSHVFVTKLAGFEHTEYIQSNETKTKINESDIPLVQGKNIRNGRFVEKYDWYISKDISDNLKRSKLNKRCILIPYVGSNLGEVGIFEHPYDCHMASNIAKVELIDGYFDLDYLKYYLQSKVGQSYLFQSKQGSAQPNITMEAIRNTLIIDKPLQEQKKISKILKNIDDKINNNLSMIETYEKITNTIFEYYFLQYKTQNNNKDLCWDCNLKMEIPTNWSSVQLKDLLYENKKSIVKVGEAREEKGNVPFFTSGEEVLLYKSSMVSGRNIFLNTGGNADVKFYDGDASYSTDTWCVNFKDYTDYIYDYLKKIKNILNESFFMGSGLKHLQKDQLKEMFIPIPDDALLVKYNKVIKPIHTEICEIYTQNNQLYKLKSDLLPLLINDQIKIKIH